MHLKMCLKIQWYCIICVWSYLSFTNCTLHIIFSFLWRSPWNRQKVYCSTTWRSQVMVFAVCRSHGEAVPLHQAKIHCSLHSERVSVHRAGPLSAHRSQSSDGTWPPSPRTLAKSLLHQVSQQLCLCRRLTGKWHHIHYRYPLQTVWGRWASIGIVHWPEFHL